MAKRTGAAVVCDVCGRAGPKTTGDALAGAVIAGWKQYPDMLTCPSCDCDLKLKGHDAYRLIQNNPTARDAYRHSRDPRYAPHLPDFGRYYLRLAELGEGDWRGSWGVAFNITNEERGLFWQLNRPGVNAVLLYKEGGQWNCKTGASIASLVYGPPFPG